MCGCILGLPVSALRVLVACLCCAMCAGVVLVIIGAEKFAASDTHVDDVSNDKANAEADYKRAVSAGYIVGGLLVIAVLGFAAALTLKALGPYGRGQLQQRIVHGASNRDNPVAGQRHHAQRNNQPMLAAPQRQQYQPMPYHQQQHHVQLDVGLPDGYDMLFPQNPPTYGAESYQPPPLGAGALAGPHDPQRMASGLRPTLLGGEPGAAMYGSAAPGAVGNDQSASVSGSASHAGTRRKEIHDPRTRLPIVEVPPCHRKYFSSLQGTVIHWFGVVDKFNRMRKLDRRVAIFSDSCIYLCRLDGGITRCVQVRNVARALIGEDAAIGFQINPPDYDMLLQVENVQQREEILTVVRAVYFRLVGRNLEITKLGGDASVALQSDLQLTKPRGWQLHIEPMRTFKSLVKMLGEQKKLEEDARTSL